MLGSGRVKRILAMALPRKWLVMRGHVKSKVIALTFDDGPHPQYTAEALDLLKQHGMKATFFFVGMNVMRYPELVRRVVEEGHQLGNHSYSHDEFSRSRLTQQLAEIDKADEVLARFDGHKRHPFRPPRGQLPVPLLAALVWRRQLVAMWSYDSLDYQDGGARSVLRRFEGQPLHHGDVVLMHDDNAETLSALRQLLPDWKGQGWVGVPLSGLGVESRP